MCLCVCVLFASRKSKSTDGNKQTDKKQQIDNKRKRESNNHVSKQTTNKKKKLTDKNVSIINKPATYSQLDYFCKIV